MVKGVIAYALNTVTNSDRGKTSAILKSIFTNAFDTAGDGYFLYRAFVESSVANTFDTAGDGYFLYRAIPESIVAYALNTVTEGYR